MAEEPTGVETEARDRSLAREILFPYLLLIGSQVPLSVVYLLNLFTTRDHYCLVALPLVVAIALVVKRWPRGDDQPFFPSVLSMVLLVIGVLLAVTGTALLSPWFGFAALVAFAASLLARTNETGRFGTLVSLAFPLLVVVQPPMGIDFDTVQGDIQLSSFVNERATALASDVLDLLGNPVMLLDYPNMACDSRLVMPTGTIDSRDLDASWSSLYTLLFLTAIFLALTRRPLFRGLALLVATVFWVMVARSLELVLCTSGAVSFGADSLGAGCPLWITLLANGLAILFILLTDQLLMFLCGPADITTIDEDNRAQFWICQIWNYAVAGVESDNIDNNVRREVRWLRWRRSDPGVGTVRTLWVSAIVCGLLAALQVINIGQASSIAGEHALRGSNGRYVTVAESALPSTLAGIAQTGHQATMPFVQSAFRGFENTWTYTDSQEPSATYTVCLTQALPGWHDAIRDFKRQTWMLAADESRFGERFDLAGFEDVPAWQARFRNEIAESAFLAFCEFDPFGVAYERPATWTSPAGFVSRAFGRLGDRIRGRLFVPRSFTIEVQATTIGPLTPEIEQRARQVLSEATRVLRAQIIEGSLPIAAVESPADGE